MSEDSITNDLAKLFFWQRQGARIQGDIEAKGSFGRSNDFACDMNRRQMAELVRIENDHESDPDLVKHFFNSFQFFGPNAVLSMTASLGGSDEWKKCPGFQTALVLLGDPSLSEKQAQEILSGLRPLEIKNLHMHLANTAKERIKEGLCAENPDPCTIKDTRDGFDAGIALSEVCGFVRPVLAESIFNTALQNLCPENPRLIRAHGAILLEIGCRLLPENGYDAFGLGEDSPSSREMIDNALNAYACTGDEKQAGQLSAIQARMDALDVPDNPVSYASAIYDHLFEAKIRNILLQDHDFRLYNGRDLQELRDFGPG